MFRIFAADGFTVRVADRRETTQAIARVSEPLELWEWLEEIDQLRAKARQAGVADLVTIERGNIFDVDLGNVSVVAVYLLPEQLERLIPQLKKLKPGSRIVSHYFKIPGVKPNSQLMVESEQTGERHQIYLWTTPLRTVE